MAVSGSMVALLLLLLADICFARPQVYVANDSIVTIVSMNANGTKNVESSAGFNVEEWHNKVCSVIYPNETLFLWDAKVTSRRAWVSIRNVNVNNAKKQQNTGTVAVFDLEHTYAQTLSKERKDDWKYWHAEHNDNDLPVWDTPTLHVATMKNVIVNTEGWIVQPASCEAVVSGGCLRHMPFYNRNRLFSPGVLDRKYIMRNDDTETFTHLYRTFEEVVSIAQTAKNWHFPMEAMPALLLIDPAHLLSESVVLQIDNPTVLTVEWLAVLASHLNATISFQAAGHMPGVHDQKIRSGSRIIRVVWGEVYAKTAIVPEMSRCGRPSRQQFAYMQKIIKQYMGRHFGKLDSWRTDAMMYTHNAPKGISPANFANDSAAKYLQKHLALSRKGLAGPVPKEIMNTPEANDALMTTRIPLLNGIETASRNKGDKGLDEYPLADGLAELVPKEIMNRLEANDALMTTRIALLKEIETVYRNKGDEGLDEYPLVVLMERRRSRPIEGRIKVQKAVREWCEERGYKLYLHDDGTAMPTLHQQLMIFRAATIVLGPHGAAEVNLIAMSPLNSCVIEFMPITSNAGCYTIMAKAMQLHYYALGYPSLSNTEWITNRMGACVETIGKQKTTAV